MKKIILGITTLACLAITSCSSDDNSTQDNPTVDITTNKLEGKWKMITGIMVYQGETQTIDLKPENCDYDYYNLKANGSKDEVYHIPESDCETENYVGTWIFNAEDSSLKTIDSEDNYTMIFKIVEFSSNRMKVKLVNDGGANPEDFGYEIYSILEK